MSVGKQYCTRQDVEILVRKLVRRIVGQTVGMAGGGGGGAGGVSAFTDLIDAPSSYVGESLHVVRVNAGEDALEFYEPCLGDLCDVFLDSAYAPNDGDCLTYDAGLGAWIPSVCGGGASGAIAVCDLADVDCVPAPANGDVLIYDAASATWIPGTRTGLTTILNEPFDGLATAAIAGQGAYGFFGTWQVSLVGTTTALVVVKAGADKMFRFTGDTVTEGSSYAYLISTFLHGMFGGTRIRFKMRCADVSSGTKGFQISTSAGVPLCQVYFRNTAPAKISFWNGTAITDLMNAVNNTWYQIDLIIRGGATTGSNVTIFIDGVQQGGPKACGANSDVWDCAGFYVNTTTTAAAVNFDADDLQIGTAYYWDLAD